MKGTENIDSVLSEVASRIGVDLSSDEQELLQEEVEEFCSEAAFLSPITPEDPPAQNVTEGTDPEGAFLYRFSLDSSAGTLESLRIAVKDNISVAGVPMTCGSASFSVTLPYHATVVGKLVAAGADVIGTTNMDEFAGYATGETCAHGRTRNPRAEGCVPGGSSSGSGAAVAAGYADAALGSDTAGSIRIPAAFCGIVGVKPTHATVSRFGFADSSPSCDSIGPLARDVETATTVLDAISGPDSFDPSTHGTCVEVDVTDASDSDISDLSIGLVAEAFEASDPRVSMCVESAVESLDVESAECSIAAFEDAPLVTDIITGLEFGVVIANHGQTYATGTGYSEPWSDALVNAIDSDALGERTRNRLITTCTALEATSGRPYIAAQNVRSRLCESVERALEQFDVLVTPTVPVTAPPFGTVTETEDLRQLIANTAPFNLTGHPAVSVPCGDVDGKPIGLQVIGERGAVETALRTARAVESEQN